MPDDIDAYYASKKRSVQREGSSGVTGWFKDLYDRLDQSWLPEQDFSKEDYVDERFGRLGQLVTAPSRAMKNLGQGIADATVGSPIRLAGTAATLATGPFGMAARLGSMAKPVGIAARGIDAIDAARSGISVAEDIQSNNVGAGTVGTAVGAGLLGASALTPISGTSRTVSGPKPNLNVTRELPEALPPKQVGEALPQAPPSLGQAPPTRQVFRGLQPLALPERTTDLINRPRGAGGTAINDNTNVVNRAGDAVSRSSNINVPSTLLDANGDISTTKVPGYSPNDSELLERAVRELDALDLPITNKALLNYRNKPEYRDRIQQTAKAKIGSQEYSPVDGKKFVLQAQTPKVVTKEVTIDDVRNALRTHGIAEPSDRMVAMVRKDKELLAKIGLGTEEVMEGAVMPSNQVKGLLNPAADYTADSPDMLKPAAGVKEVSEEVVGAKLPSQFPTLPPLQKITEVGKKTTDPELRNVTQIFEQVEKRRPSIVRDTTNSLVKSIESELADLGDAGKEISRQLKIVDTDSPIRFNAYIKDIGDDVRKVDDKTFTEVVDVLEGATTNNKQAQALADRIKQVLDTTGSDLNNLGLLEKGTVQNYWPRRFDGIPEKTIQENLRAAGKSEDEIIQTLDKIRQFREQKITAEHSRNLTNLPGYRKDKDVLIDHLRDVAKRVESASMFGAKDVADTNSPISKLISQTTDPTRARDLVTRALRGARETSETQKTWSSGIRQYATASQLSLAAISNFGGMLPIVVRSTVSDSINAIGQAFNKQMPEMKFMENANLFRKFSGGFAEAVNDNNRLYKLFGIEGSQNWLNRYAAATANGYVKVLFDELKRNPSNERVAKQLEDLVLDNPRMVASQDELTTKQIERAMVRMAEITQGTTDNRKLPYGWVTDGVGTIPQIFLRTAFQTSKAMYGGIAQDPARAIPKFLGAGWLIGELIGDTKEAVKTGAQVSLNTIQQALGQTDEDLNLVDQFKENIELGGASEESRMSWTRSQLARISPELAKNDLVVRSLANYQQAFALGLPADIIETMLQASQSRNPAEVVASFFWAFDEANNLGRTVFSNSPREVGREIIKRTPFIGRGAVREVDSERQSKQSGKGSYSEASW